MTVIHKQTSAEVDPRTLEYVMSDGSVDRMGDIIEPGGWQLAAFKRNPIALFGHSGGFPIGRWEDVRVDGGKLKGRLEFARPGTSARIDEIRSLAEQGILKAVSVGFQPVPGKVEPIENSKRGGVRYKEAELVECSIVSVPANPNALQIARGLHVSDDTLEMVFGKSAVETVRRDITGKSAASPPAYRKSSMSYAEQIGAKEQALVAKRDQITQLVKDVDEGIEGAVDALEAANGEVAKIERTLNVLRDAERNLAFNSDPINKAGNGSRPFATPAEKVAPLDLLMRSLVAKLHSHATKGEVSPSEALAMRYGSDGRVSDEQKVVFDVVTKAATAPATTSTSGWASQLVQTSYAAFMDLLIPASVYPGLASRGLRMNFGNSGVISIPSRSSTPTIAGSFVLEGNPIPVRQGAFASQTFTPKKMAVITTFTREIAEHSNPSIEGLLRNAIQEDTSVALDTVLLDATAASTTRPAGLRNGVTETTATSGGGFAALVGDLQSLVGALITGSNGNLRAPVWIMNPVNALAISVTQNAGGDFPFAAEINQNRFQGYPVILSSTVTADMVIMVDAADFVAIEGGMPRFDVSDQATVHLEDTTPLAIGTAGTPNTVAAPVRSLFQTDSMALRMIMPINWGMRRSGVVAWTSSVTW